MADTLPLNFPLPPESSVASYNYVDIAEGTGIVELYGFSCQDNSAISYILDRNSPVSDTIEYSHSGDATITFNLSAFNTPRVIGGTAFIAFSGDTWNSASGSTGYFVLTLQKVSGVAVTDIGTVTTKTISVAAAGNTTASFLAKIAVSDTNFKIGDNLRLTVRGVTSAGASYVLTIGIDPASRDGTYISGATYPTTFKAYIPFRINL